MDDEDDEPPPVNWTPGGEGRGDDPGDWSDDRDTSIDWRKWE